MKTIDLRSDTKTLPTEDMRQAMYRAELGDDVSREDPTVNRLEALAASITGKEAALFVPSGIMSNLLAVLALTEQGDEILLGSQSHMFWYEVGGASAVGGVVMRTVLNEPDGRMELENIACAVRPENIHFPPTTLLCLENTHNRCGGAPLDQHYTAEAAALAHRLGLKVHIDGARIFSAAVALKVPVEKLVKGADSVSFCISKNLSAPVGSLLCGQTGFIERARKLRRMLGGGMRQAGVLAAAGIVALEEMVDRLAEDHENARSLAYGLAGVKGIKIEPERFKTNIVIFEPPEVFSPEEFIEEMATRGVKFSSFGGRKIRAVTHRMISSSDIDQTLKQVKLLVFSK